MPRRTRREVQEEKRKEQEKEYRIEREMSRYLRDNLINSYYEFEIVAFRDHPEWVPIMRKKYMREHLYLLCRECKLYHNKTYARPLEETLAELRRVKQAYYAKQQKEMMEEMEREQAAYEAAMFAKETE